MITRKQTYEAYLHSDEWKTLRFLVIQRDKNCCQKCHRKKIEHVHHLRYRRLFSDTVLDDLVGMCYECHALVHVQKDPLWIRLPVDAVPAWKDSGRVSKRRKRRLDQKDELKNLQAQYARERDSLSAQMERLKNNTKPEKFTDWLARNGRSSLARYIKNFNEQNRRKAQRKTLRAAPSA